jgi:hypothetical protein
MNSIESQVFNIKELRLLIFSFMIENKNNNKRKKCNIKCISNIINKILDKFLIYIFMNHYVRR